MRYPLPSLSLFFSLTGGARRMTSSLTSAFFPKSRAETLAALISVVPSIRPIPYRFGTSLCL
jgi:hypothetical protein